MTKLEKAQQVLQLVAKLDLTLHEVVMADCYTGVEDILKDTPEDDDDAFRKDLTMDAFNDFIRTVDVEEIYAEMF